MHPIHASLTRQSLLSGGNRFAVMVLYVIAAILVFTYPLTYVTVGVAVLLVTIGHSVLIYLCYEDEDWWPILLRHSQQQSYYLAGPTLEGGAMLFVEAKEPETYADLLPYDLMPAPGIVTLKNEGLVAAFAYTGPDLEVAEEEALRGLSHHINAGLRKFGSGWSLHCDLFRYESRGYPTEGAFPDPTSRLIDDERRKQYEAEATHYESITCFALSYQQPAGMRRRLKAFFAEDDKQGTMDEAIAFFAHQVNAAIDILGGRLRLVRLEGDDLLTYLHWCTTGQSYRVAMPNPPIHLDVLLGNQDVTGGYLPEVGEFHTRTITVTGFPAESKPAILAFLNTLPCTYRWNSRFVFADPDEARTEIKAARRNWDASTIGIIDKIMHAYFGEAPRFENLDAKALTEDANVALGELDSGAVRYGRYTSVIVLHHTEERTLETIARNVESELQNHQFPARKETKNALEAFLGSLPGMVNRNVRKKQLHTLNVADLLPTTTIWPGLEYNPCPYYPPNSPALLHAATRGQTPFRLNLHVDDVGHFLMIGPTGSGKTTHNNLVMAQFRRYPGAQIRCFDRGTSATLITAACGGQNVDLGNDQSVKLYPLGHIEEEGGRIAAAEWIEACLVLQGVEVGVEQRKAIYTALELMASEEHRSVSTFLNTVQDLDVREGMRAYTLERPYGWLFDAEQDELIASDFVTFNLAHLIEAGDKYLIPALLHIFSWIERGLDGRPTLIPIDEGWMALLHEKFAAQFIQWLRTCRDRNAAVGLITHSLSDINRSEYKELLLEMCKTKIFLPNVEATSEHIAPLYEAVGLNSKARALLAEMVPKRDYLYTASFWQRTYQLGCGPVALAFCGKGGDENRRQWQALQAVSKDTWPAAWLSKLGCKEEARQWREFMQQSCL